MLETGGEDLPDAYRSVPVCEEHLRFNIVATYNVEIGVWQYQIVWGCLFGLSSSVMNFNPFSKFMAALARRWLFLLLSMFYDDATIQDLSCAKGRGQRYGQALFRMMGTPFNPKKSTSLCEEAEFLGLQHNVGEALSLGVVKFVPREKIVQKSQSLIDQCLESNYCTPAEASKIRGVRGFTMSAKYGKLGRVGMGPLKQRQYFDVEPFLLSGELRRSLHFCKAIDQCCPERVVNLRAAAVPPLVIASDGRVDDDIASSAFLIFDPITNLKYGACNVVTQEWRLVLGEQMGIQAVEAMPIVGALMMYPAVFRNRDVIWFEDRILV